MLSLQSSNEFISFLQGYSDFYAEFADVENGKYEVISQNDVIALDSFVSKEQAYLLRSRGLELERDKIMSKNNCAQLSLREFIGQLDSTVQPKARELFEFLTDSMYLLKDRNARCNSLAELRLHRIGVELERLEQLPKAAYNSSAKTGQKPLTSISKKI